MRRSRPAFLPLALCLAALALAPAAAAPAGLHGLVEATGASAHAPATIDGPLVALWQEPADAGAAAPAFTLRAPELRVEVDSADPVAGTPVDRVRFNPRTDPPRRHTDVVVEGTSNGAGYRWTLLATDPADPPRITVASNCAQAGPAARDALVRRPLVNLQRGDAARDLAHAIGWGCLDGAAVEVRGNVTLSLWAWNATLASREGREELGSGDGPSWLPGGVLRRQAEVYLVAADATLTLPALFGPGALLHTGGGTTLATHSLLLQGTTGRLEAAGHPIPLSGSAVGIEGDAALGLWGAGAGKPFAATLGGEADRVSVDGAAVSLTAAARLPSLGSPVGWAIALTALAWLATEARRSRLARDASWGVAPLLAPPLTWRERRGTGFWVLARQAAMANRLRRAHAQVRRSLRWFPASTDARLLDAAIQVKRGEYADALHTLDSLYRHLPPGPESFEVAAMASSSAMMVARHADAVLWLRKAAAADPLAFTQEVKKPLYDPLVGDAWFRSARGSFARAYLAGEGMDPAFS